MKEKVEGGSKGKCAEQTEVNVLAHANRGRDTDGRHQKALIHWSKCLWLMMLKQLQLGHKEKVPVLEAYENATFI